MSEAVPFLSTARSAPRTSYQGTSSLSPILVGIPSVSTPRADSKIRIPAWARSNYRGDQISDHRYVIYRVLSNYDLRLRVDNFLGNSPGFAILLAALSR